MPPPPPQKKTPQKNPHLFYTASSFVHHFKASEFILELQSGNAKLGSRLVIFSCLTLQIDVWPWQMIGHLSYATSSFVHHILAIGEFKLKLQSGTARLGWESAFFYLVTLKFDGWPMKTAQKRSTRVKIGDLLFRVTLKFNAWSRGAIRQLFYANSSFEHHLIATCKFKLELQCGNPQFGSKSSIFRSVWPCNLADEKQ